MKRNRLPLIVHSNPELVSEFSVEMNKGIDLTKLTQGSNRSVWWICSECGLEWKSQVCNRATGRRTGCPDCSRIFKVQPQESLAYCYPEIASELYGSSDPYSIAKHSQQKLEWECSHCGFIWWATVANRTYRKSGCPPCGKSRQIKSWSKPRPSQSLSDLYPEVARMMVPDPVIDKGVTADDVRPKTKKKFRWKCPTCSHEWVGRPVVIIGSNCNGCKKCGAKSRGSLRASPGPGGSLQEKYPDIARELISSRDPFLDASQLKYASSKVVWWRCSDCSFEWVANPARRVSGVGCPACNTTGFTLPKLKHIVLNELSGADYIPSEILKFLYYEYRMMRTHSVSRKIVEAVIESEITPSDLYSWCAEGRSNAVDDIIKQYSPTDYKRRRSLRLSVKATVFERDRHKCLCCGSSDSLCVDHIIPVCRGGGDEIENLQSLCTRCNLTKSGKVITLEELRDLVAKKSSD